MSRIRLIEALAQKLDVSEDEASEFIVQMVDTLTEALIEQRRVEFDDFGTFSMKTSKPRTAVNIQTQEVYPIPPQDYPAFEPAAALIEAVLPRPQPPVVAAT
ncbi:MAG: HU family DNA-binding protein [Chloroflexi bacterium]|nr:HU family DNA-binding protein [Chloroflexota bacterium]